MYKVGWNAEMDNMKEENMVKGCRKDFLSHRVFTIIRSQSKLTIKTSPKTRYNVNILYSLCLQCKHNLFSIGCITDIANKSPQGNEIWSL